jgi:hypothetical protein
LETLNRSVSPHGGVVLDPEGTALWSDGFVER